MSHVGAEVDAQPHRDDEVGGGHDVDGQTPGVHGPTHVDLGQKNIVCRFESAHEDMKRLAPSVNQSQRLVFSDSFPKTLFEC